MVKKKSNLEKHKTEKRSKLHVGEGGTSKYVWLYNLKNDKQLVLINFLSINESTCQLDKSLIEHSFIEEYAPCEHDITELN